MRIIFSLLLFSFLFTACRDDFSLEAPFKDIPVVSAYLDAKDGQHFVRVQKVFLGQNGNGALSATVEDSLYYNDNEATVTLMQGTQEVVLERVNGEDFGLEREEGAFVNSPNVLYRFDDGDLNLAADQDVTLSIERSGEPTATTTTRTIGDIDIIMPDDNISIHRYNRRQNWRWMVTPGARVFDVRVYINIREFFPSNPDMNRDRRLEWVLTEQLIADEDETRVVFELENEEFWQFLNANLEVNADVRRVLDNIDLVVTAVGGEIESQIDLLQANSGITSAIAVPNFSNVENGLGIFTSRATAIKEEITIDGALDTLRDGIYTRDLNFQ